MDMPKYITDEEGNRYIRRNVNSKLLGLSFAEKYYPVAIDNPYPIFILAVFGGWLGIHKFISKDYIQGILYFITCGGFGIFYVMDVIAMATGTYYIIQSEINTDGIRMGEKYIKKRIYLDAIESVIYSILGPLISIGIAYLSYRYIYVKVLTAMGIVISNGIFNLISGAV